MPGNAVAVSLVFVFLALTCWGLWRQKMRLGYCVVAILLGLTMAGTSWGVNIKKGMDWASRTLSSISSKVSN